MNEIIITVGEKQMKFVKLWEVFLITVYRHSCTSEHVCSCVRQTKLLSISLFT